MSSEIIGDRHKVVVASGQRASVWLLLRLVFSVNSALMNDDKTIGPKSQISFYSAALLFLLTFTSLDMQSCSKKNPNKFTCKQSLQSREGVDESPLIWVLRPQLSGTQDFMCLLQIIHIDQKRS